MSVPAPPAIEMFDPNPVLAKVNVSFPTPPRIFRWSDEVRADAVRELGADPVVAEMGDPKTLEPALAGVERAYLVSPVSPMQAEYEQVFVETAKAAGVQHVVKLSVIGASGESPLRFARNHAVV